VGDTIRRETPEGDFEVGEVVTVDPEDEVVERMGNLRWGGNRWSPLESIRETNLEIITYGDEYKMLSVLCS